MKIVVADDLPASALDLLRAEGWDVDARTGRTPDQLAADLADADAIVVRSATKVTAALIAAAPQLRVIARAGTGVDNVDVAAASARGIVVMNAPGANSISVAELALGLMLALARHLPAADAAMKQGKWEKKKFLGEEVRDKTLGLAGLGRIGQEVARRAAAFGMRIIAHDPFISEQVAADLGVELVSLDDLFARADYVSLHMPSNDEDAATSSTPSGWRSAKKGIRIINTARGDLIDEKALADAIEAGQVAGAALDVFAEGADRRSPAADAAAGRGHAAHRRVHARGPGTGRRGDGRRAARLPARRHHPQRGQLSVGLGRGVQPAAAVRRARRAARRVPRADERQPRPRRSASATTASWPRAATT